MYYNDEKDALSLAEKSDFAIFVDFTSENFPAIFSENLPPGSVLTIKPNKNNIITIDQIREIIAHSQSQQKTDYYVVIMQADKMHEKAQNAFLKLLEEPPKNYHFVMQVKNASELLPTILSRGDLFCLKIEDPVSTPVIAEDLVKNYAKLLISAKDSDLVSIVNRLITEKDYKKDSRGFATAMAECAIEILYKSYFKTKNIAYLKKLPRFLTLLDNLKQNGHIKLHLVADLC